MAAGFVLLSILGLAQTRVFALPSLPIRTEQRWAIIGSAGLMQWAFAA
jgi:hypothetical protein